MRKLRKKRAAAFALCAVLLLCLIPSAMAAPLHDSYTTDSAYANAMPGLVDDGVVGIEILPTGGGGFDFFFEGTTISVDNFWSAVLGGWVPPFMFPTGNYFAAGFEGALTFRITNKVLDYMSIDVSMWTLPFEVDSRMGVSYVPKTAYEEGGPMDDQGRTPPVPPPGFGALPSIYSDFYAWYPAYLLDKIQFAAYASDSLPTNPFRWDDTAGGGAAEAPKAPANIGGYMQSSGWMSTWDWPAEVPQASVSIPYNGVAFIHYIFFWEASPYKDGKSPVAPSKRVQEMEEDSLLNMGGFVLKEDADGDGVDEFFINDNYYNGAGALYSFMMRGTPGEPNATPRPTPWRPDITNPPPTEPPNPPPSETPFQTESPLETEDVTIDVPIVSPPTEPPEESVVPPTLPLVDPETPNDHPVPLTGGFDLANLFFIGLFLCGIGLIYLKSRKREDEGESKQD